MIQTPGCAGSADHNGPQLVTTARTSFADDLSRPKRRAAPTAPHARFFTQAGPHGTNSATCHADGILSRYSCYSCHEHQPGRIRAGHAEESIRNIVNCARCHRSGSGEGGEGSGRDDD